MSRFAFLALLLSLLLLAGRPSLVRAEEETAPVDLETAQRDLKLLEDSIDDKKAINETITANLKAVRDAYLNLAVPAKPEPKEVPADASEEQQKEIEDENKKAEREYEREFKKWSRDVEKFRKDAIDAFLDALTLTKIHRQTETNIRDEANIAAAQVLGEIAAAKFPEFAGLPEEEQADERADILDDVSKDIIKQLEGRIFKAKYTVPQALLDEVFLTLAKLNRMDSLEWMIKEFIHTKNRREEVDRLVAAHKAMIHFQDVPGKLRYQLVDEFLKIYPATESQAMQSSTDAAVQAAKQFWDRIKYDTIKVVQVYAREPKDDTGAALGSMQELRDWFRDNDNPRRDPWTDPEG